MFQNNDWEIGEDFLDDFLSQDQESKTKLSLGEKQNSPEKRNPDSKDGISFFLPEEKIQKTRTDIKVSSRKNKILQICASSTIQTLEISNQGISENVETSIQQNPENAKIDQTSRKKILDMFKKAADNSSEFRIPANPKPSGIVIGSQNHSPLLEKTNSPGNLNLSQEEARKNLMNSILKRSKKTVSDKQDPSEREPKTLSRQNLLNSILKKSAERVENSQTPTQEIQEAEELNISNSEVDNLPKVRRNVSFSDIVDERAERRKKLIIDTVKKGLKNSSPSTSNFIYKNDESTSSNNSRSRNDSKSSTRTRQVITRKYPGPAGLFPDNADLTKFPMAYLSSFDESEKDGGLNESRISNFCSQNTKNLFTGGAWQTMIDDLPPDFLQGHEISTIKKNARKGLYKTEKAPFIAGICHHFDSNWVENPMILLKDSTDQIEANFHSDIFNMYPNCLEAGTVILFKDVGIIVSRLYLYALIHPNDIVAIYSEKDRIFTSELMERILEEEEKRGCPESGYSGENENREKASRENFREKENSFPSELEIDLSFRKEAGNWRKEVEEESEEEINREDQVELKTVESATTSLPQIIETEHFSNILNDLDDDDEAFLSINIDEITASQSAKHFASSTLIESQISSEEKENNPVKRKRGLQEREKTTVKKRCNQREESVRKSLSAKNYLKQFRNKDDLTQPEVNIEDEEREEKNERIDDKKEGNKAEISNFSDLLDSDNDSEEVPMNIDSVLENVEKPSKECNENTTGNYEGNSERGEKHLQSIFEDPVDEILSQMDMDAFNFDE